MRIVKQRLPEMIPGLRVFLDVDGAPLFRFCHDAVLGQPLTDGARFAHPSDLEDISNLEGYIERSRQVLVFCSQDYFQSKNCMREIRAAVERGIPLLAVLELDSTKGGLQEYEIKEQLLAGWRDREGCWRRVEETYAAWGFQGGPRPEDLVAALFATEPIEYERIGEYAQSPCPPKATPVAISRPLTDGGLCVSPGRRRLSRYLYAIGRRKSTLPGHEGSHLSQGGGGLQEDCATAATACRVHLARLLQPLQPRWGGGDARTCQRRWHEIAGDCRGDQPGQVRVHAVLPHIADVDQRGSERLVCRRGAPGNGPGGPHLVGPRDARCRWSRGAPCRRVQHVFRLRAWSHTS